MSDKFDDDKERDGSDSQPIADETLLRGSDHSKAESNNDATVVRSRNVDATESPNDDSTILRPKKTDTSRDRDRNDNNADSAPETPRVPSDDETVLRARDSGGASDSSKVSNKIPNDDATVLRGDSLPPTLTEQSGVDETIIRKDNPGTATASRDGAIPPDVGGDATILRAPGEGDPATILRPSESAAGAGRADTADATILREPGEDGSTILRGVAGEGEDATVLRVGGEGDEDRTVLNDNYDDDSTVLGPGSGKQDTTYIASIGKQIRPQGNSEAGRLLKNRFVLEEKIGSGGMGDVYKALDLRQQEAQERDPYIAIKLLNENFSRHKDAFLSLQRETSRTRGIPHPNIMGVYDFDREGDTVFMSMELLDGKPLDDYLKEHPEGVSHEDAWRIIDGISQGLMRAHNAGIVHSDFKPGNIFYTKDKEAKVFDFGIARAISNPGELVADGEKTVFDAGSLGALTPTYASYEMLKGLEPSKSDDVYAVALVAYELFMGKHPYDRVPADKALERGLKPKPIPFMKRRHWRALKKALELKGEDRTQSIDEFYEGVFSLDPPYFRYAAVATVLIGSIGFGAYQTMNVVVKPSELVGFDDAIAGAKITLGTRTDERFQSEDWHNQLAQALNRFKLSEQKILENPEWVEQWGYEPDPLINSITDEVLALYLKRIALLREDAQTYDNERREDGEGVTQAMELLAEARSYMARVEEHYRNADPAAVDLELERLERRINIRNQQLEEIVAKETLDKEKETARLAQLEADRVQEEFEDQRLQAYNLHLDEVRKILRCKGDISDDEVSEFGRLLSSMKQEWPDAYDKHYPTVVGYMATCIQQRIGFVDPERARTVKSMVTGYLPGEARIASLVIEDKDPCDERNLIGKGNRNRSWCQDNLSEGGEGPELVVIPPITVKDHKFAISRAEIKIGEYNYYCQKVGCAQVTSGNSSLPATNLSVEEARSYTSWLSQQTGQKYRLPSVREWSHAATVQGQEKLVDENINCTVDSRGVRLGEKLLNAISGRSNSWGLYNFVGNAREWALTADGGLVALGGAHTDPRQQCTLDKRVAHGGEADAVTGFRIVREIQIKDDSGKEAGLAASS